jgi:SRSO17 transposase
VAVERQWNGRLGKLDNCQVGVFATLCNKTFSTLVDFRLYLSQEWARSPQRCQKAGIPVEHQKYKSKIELAQELVEEALAAEASFEWVVADAVYGSLAFAHYLNNRGIRFALDMRSNQPVYLEDPQPYLPQRQGPIGRRRTKLKTAHKAVTVKEQLERIQPQQWKTVRVRKGTKGYLWVKAFATRVFFWNARVGEKPAQWWLVITRDIGSGDIKYFFSNMPAQTTIASLVRIHRHRYWIERSFQDAKTSVGLAQYQVRCWQGWHHHMALCLAAMLFMLQIKVNHNASGRKPTSQTIIFCMTVLIPSRIQSVEDMQVVIAKRNRKHESAEKSALRRQKRQTLSAPKVPK